MQLCNEIMYIVFTSRLSYIAYKPLFYCGHVYFAVYYAHVHRYRLNDVGENFAKTDE